MKESFQEGCYRLARHYGELSSAYYSDKRAMHSGADPIDAYRWGLVRKALVLIGQGNELNKVLDVITKEWTDFCYARQKQVEAAPKLKYGPMSGNSVIHHKWAGEGQIDGDLIFIRNTCATLKASQAEGEEKNGDPDRPASSVH